MQLNVLLLFYFIVMVDNKKTISKISLITGTHWQIDFELEWAGVILSVPITKNCVSI